MVGLAVILTKAIVDEKLIANTALSAVFGYNNICVYWDYSPVREIIAVYFPLVEVPLLMYVMLVAIRSHTTFKQGKITNSLKVANIAICVCSPSPWLWLCVIESLSGR